MNAIDMQKRTLALFEEVRKVAEPSEIYRFEQLTSEFMLGLPRYLAHIPARIPRHVDIGCGGGMSLLLWSQLTDESFGIDLPETIEGARRFYAKLPAHLTKTITLQPSTAEDAALPGTFDLITTQYVLEHVNSIPDTLANIRRHLREGGTVIHTLPHAISRSTWYMEYREQKSPLYRIAHSVYRAGVLKTLRNPFGFTPPHEPRFGDFQKELDEYRIDRWAIRIFRAGFTVVDYFQTEDINWVAITKPMD